MEHSKVEPASEEEKAKLAEVLATVPEGPEVMVVSGGVVSGGVVGGVMNLFRMFAVARWMRGSTTPDLSRP
jgi:hypothetical protein